MVGCCMSPGHCHTKRERRQEALELRKAGKTYTQIAQELGCSNPSVAGRYVRTALQESIREPTAEVRELEVAHLDALWEQVWPRLKTGDIKAVDTALRIM
jgi:transposase-like protein